VSVELVSVLAGAVPTALVGACGPALIRRLPEPSSQSAGYDDDKVPYAHLASRPHLGSQLAVTGAVVGALLGWRLGRQPVLAAWVYLAGVGVVLAYVDARTRLLPTRVIAPSYVVVVGLVALAGVVDADPHRLVRSALGWLGMGGFYLLLWLVYPRGLGYGDVRLSGLLGIALGYLGWASLLTGLYAGFLLGAVGGGLLMVLRRPRGGHFPFGPFMLLGALVGVLFGSSLSSLYLSW
jgi:leader peptidase (prepilin peptidase) / N-methyltransferase